MFLRRKSFLIILLVLSLLASFSIAYGEEDLGSWVTKTSMLNARYGLGAAELNGKIYAMGGYLDGGGSTNAVEQYDTANDTWTTKTSMPTDRYGLGVVEANGKIYAIGGYVIGGSNQGKSNAVEEYDPDTDTWTTKTSMPNATQGLGLVEVNGKIYAIGGYTIGNVITNAVEEYDPDTDTWTTKTSMPTNRRYLGVVEVNGKIYAIGGDANSGGLDAVEEYDPDTDTWTTKASMPTPRKGLGVVEANGKIYAIGGYSTSDISNVVEEYDPGTDTWTTKTSISIARQLLGVAESNGKIYAIGGNIGNSSSVFDIVEEFTVATSEVSSPINLTATAGDSEVEISWDSVTDADSYNVYRATTSGGPYTTVAQEVYEINYTDTNVTNGTTYYYVVTAVNTDGESDNSDEASVTLIDSSNGNKALLRITMINGTINEYDLSMDDVDTFIEWYEDRGDGNGDSYYAFSKDYNAGPFVSRTDYIAYDKILQFEVMEYTE